MPLKILSVQKSSDFKQISKKDHKFFAKTLILLTAPTPEFYLENPVAGKNAKDFCRFGLTVSKTVGNAVVRNLAKRRIREACRELISYAKNHRDYVIIARKEIADSDFKKIVTDLKFCLTRIDNVKPNQNSSNHGRRKKTQ